MADTDKTSSRRGLASIAPLWLWLSLLTILLWGAWGLQAKIIAEKISPWMNQVLFPIGLLPPLAWMLFSKNLRKGVHLPKGSIYAFITGIRRHREHRVPRGNVDRRKGRYRRPVGGACATRHCYPGAIRLARIDHARTDGRTRARAGRDLPVEYLNLCKLGFGLPPSRWSSLELPA